MEDKWKFILFLGVTVALASLTMSYLFSDITGAFRIIAIGVITLILASIGYKLFYKKTSET